MSVEKDNYEKLIKQNQDAAQASLDEYKQQMPTLSERPTTPSVRKTTYEDLHKQLFETPMSQEEEERRKRAATAVNGIAGLGNVANAFANLIYTGKGAPNQTLPTYKGSDLQAFSDRVSQARRLYGQGIIQGRQMDDADYNQQEANRRADEAYNADVRLKNYNLIGQLYDRQRNIDAANLEGSKNAWSMANTESQQALQQKNADRNYNLSARQVAISEKNQQNQEKWHNDEMDLYNRGLKGGSGNRNANTRVSYGSGKNQQQTATAQDYRGNWYTIDVTKLGSNEATLSSIYQHLPKEIREKYDSEVLMAGMTSSGDKSKARMSAYQNAIGDAFANDQTGEVVESLKQGGYAVPYQLSEQDGSFISKNSGNGGGSFISNAIKK